MDITIEMIEKIKELIEPPKRYLLVGSQELVDELEEKYGKELEELNIHLKIVPKGYLEMTAGINRIFLVPADFLDSRPIKIRFE